ncbi:MAG: DUF1460 domain-containing protein [Duncaniella sp.]|nr:DUF1460 domain-containing protein [Duncaniella sp.]
MAVAASAITPVPVHWHNEKNDTLQLDSLLRVACDMESDGAQGRVGRIARMFVGVPYKSGTLEIAPEGIVVNLDSMDCTTFVETVAAMAVTADERRDSWQDFVHNLGMMRYRGGKIDGYASRLHYISDWILDNSHRGNVVDVTSRMPDEPAYQVKTIDFMSRHRDLYPALKDDAEYEKLKNAEIGYRNHRFPYIKSGSFLRKGVASALRDGDIVALISRKSGLDVSHVGIIAIVDGVPHLLHASSRHGKVMIDPLPLSDYLKKSRDTLGLRIVRLKDR